MDKHPSLKRHFVQNCILKKLGWGDGRGLEFLKEEVRCGRGGGDNWIFPKLH